MPHFDADGGCGAAGTSRKRSRAECDDEDMESVNKKKRDIQKHVFEFVYRGKFNIDLWKDNEDLELQSVETCQGTHGYWYALIKISKKKRASQLQKMFEAFDREATPAMQIRLTNLPGEPTILSFGPGSEFRHHIIYKEIQRAMAMQCGTYFSWSCDSGVQNVQASSLSTGRASGRLSRLLETDLVSSAYSPACPRQQRAIHTKLANNAVRREVASAALGERFQSAISSQIAVDQGNRGLNESCGGNPLEDIQDNYASDPEDPCLPESEILNQPPQAVELETLLQDENSMDSAVSLGCASSASLSPGTRLKEIHASMKILVKECRARDYLASNNERKDREIADEKHKRKSQEGKTAAQTRKVNLANQGEAKALEEKAIADANAERQRQLREMIEADKSTLMIANAGFSTMMLDLRHSAGDKVGDLLLKHGSVYLDEFIFHLRSRNLTQEEPDNRRSLKGVAPALPFSEAAYLRYFEHCMAYSDFKDASKSDDKHRLYLGLFSGSLYMEAVLYYYRERLLDLIEALCALLGRVSPFAAGGLDPILPPVQGCVFDLDEMKAWKSGVEFNTEKMRSLQERFPEVDAKTHWMYLVFLHRCNFKGRLGTEDSKTLFRMLQSPMYSEAAFIAMEKPLMAMLNSLRAELKEKHPQHYWQLSHHWAAIARQMQRPRDSAHRVVNPEEGRANEYFVFARGY